MQRAAHRQPRNGLVVLEEAAQLLRTLPAAALAAYYFGTLPFLLGLLYFWADMSRHPYAHEHVAAAALGLAVLYVWMKVWQVVFAWHLRAQLAAAPPPAWEWRRLGRVVLTQGVVQPVGLLYAPLALVSLLSALQETRGWLFTPFLLPLCLTMPWAGAFFQNLTVLDDGATVRLRALVQSALRETVRWWGQNAVACALLALFAFFVFCNWFAAGRAVPELAKSLLGVESVFTRNGGSLMNTTFFAAVGALTYLCVDPIAKAVYALRCFYAESLHSGGDLRAELKRLALAAKSLAVAAAVAALFAPLALPAAEAPATESPPPESPAVEIPDVERAVPLAPTPPPAIAPADLDQSLSEVIQGGQYVWRQPRLPRVAPGDAEEGVLARFLKACAEMIHDAAKAVWEWLIKLLRALFPDHVPEESGGGGVDWMATTRALLFLLLLVVAAILGIILYRYLRDRRRRSAVAGAPMASVPDLADENVTADQLPEDGWTRLARELLARGEFRLALRAFYLSSLAHLAGRQLIRLAKFKSNRDYERELRRREHALPELLLVFGHNVAVFDSIWYGAHEVTEERVRRFAANVEKIKAGA